MAEKDKNIQLNKKAGLTEAEKLETVKKADAAVKSMSDFTSPEELYQELISSVKKYHPSTDINMIRHTRLLKRLIRIRSGSRGNPISFTLSA